MTNSDNLKQTSFDTALLALTLKRTDPVPLQIQLTQALRRLILAGQAEPGARVPPSRVLAEELGVSRSTVLAATDQLTAEGYLSARRGAGTYVVHDLPDEGRWQPVQTSGPPAADPAPVRPFHPSMPDMAAFPHARWARLLNQAWRHPEPALLMHPDPMGWLPLRAAIATHLAAWRGVGCSAGQVVITSGAQEAFGLIATLMPPGGDVLIEDPSFAPMRRVMSGAGLTCRPVPVDADGFDISKARGPAAGVVVTPSRHYPLGMTLPLNRRLALLDWAGRHNALIVEDDYDSEFRYEGQPLPALMSLDQGGNTIYVGSFSKLLSPALRLGYLVLPPGRVKALSQALKRRGPQASMVPQPALAAFIQSGGFAIHLRRMRRLYRERQKALLQALEQHLDGWLVAHAEPSGMHLVCHFGPALHAIADTEVAQAGAAAGLTLSPLSAYFTSSDPPQGLVLGFAGFDTDTLHAMTVRLAKVMRPFGA